MPSQFDIVFPSKGRIKFSGGLNNKYSEQLIDNNESPDCLNVVLGADSVATRGGTDKINTASVGSFPGDGLYTRHDNDSSQTMCAWWNGTMYTLAGSTFTTAGSAQSVFTADTRVSAAEYENHIFFGNGGSNPYKYNGTDFTLHGIRAPNSGPTAATAPTGTNLTGDYRYKITYVNSALVEGDVNTTTGTFTAASEDIRLTSLPVAPQSFGVDTRRIYRTDAGGTTFKRLTTINDNTTTTYDDAIADGALGISAPADQGVPPNYTISLYHQNRLFTDDPGNPGYVWYSELNNPYVFKATNFIRVGDNTGDLLKGLQVYDDSILTFCDNSQWIIYMADTDPANWKPIRVRSNFGSKSHFGSFLYNNKIMFPAIQNNKLVGFSAVSGASIEPSATFLTTSAIGSELKSNKIEPDIFLLEESEVSKISSFVYQNKAYITVSYGISQATNNRIYVFDFSIGDILKKQEGAWVPWTGINAEQMTEYNGDLYYISSDDTGFVHKMNTDTYNDDGAAINSYYWTKEFSGNGSHEIWDKDFRRINILFEKSGDWFMDFTYRVDSDKGVGKTVQVDLDPGGSLWGTMRWGTDTWGGGKNNDEEKIFLGNTVGKRIQYKFSNQNKVNQKFQVMGINFLYNLKGKR